MKKLSPLHVYKLLPQTNCQECGLATCMAFATKLLDRSLALELCTPILESKYASKKQKLSDLLEPAVKQITMGQGENSVKIGGEDVMYRHDLTFFNETAIAIDISDELSEKELQERVKYVDNFKFERIGQKLTLQALAIKSKSNNKDKFTSCVKKVQELTNMPLILCCLDPEILEEALKVCHKNKPLIYAATEQNYEMVANLALEYNCPVVVSSPGDPSSLLSIANALQKAGLKEIVLDPGTFPYSGYNASVNMWESLRKSAIFSDNKLAGYPILTIPATAYLSDLKEQDKKFREVLLSALSVMRFSDLMIMHTADIWAIMPVITLRQNIYTDPRVPVAVDAGLRKFGSPDKDSPVFMTTNFALTYYTVESDIQSANLDCYLLVVDTEGIGVESAVAGAQLTAAKTADIMKEVKLEETVSHKRLILPEMAARIKWELEDTTGWEVLIGPRDSSGIPKYIETKWNAS